MPETLFEMKLVIIWLVATIIAAFIIGFLVGGITLKEKKSIEIKPAICATIYFKTFDPKGWEIRPCVQVIEK